MVGLMGKQEKSMTLPTLRRSRSNRPLTQFALGCLDLFLVTSNYLTDRSKGNTAVKCTRKDHIKKFEAFVFGEKIIQVMMFDNEPVAVDICIDENFDESGNPIDDVVERLNGFLDALGTYSVLPKGVRVFRDREEEIFYLGKGEQKIPIGLLHAHKVSIQADSEELRMTVSTSSVND
jgi:hypothetical protein